MNKILNASITIDGKKYSAFDVDCDSVKVNITESGNGYTYRKMVVSNPTDKNSPQVTAPRVIDAVIPCKSSAKMHTIWGCNCNHTSFKPIDVDFEIGDTHEMMPICGGSSSGYAAPFWDVVVDGKPYLFSLGWSGQWVCNFKRTEDAFIISAGMQFADFYIKPGEELNLPSVCIFEGEDGEDVSSLRRKFRRLLMTEMSPFPKNVKKAPIAMCLINRYVFMNPTPFYMSYEGQKKVVEACQRIGNIDTLWHDACWFKGGFPSGVGNYTYHEGFKDGMKKVSDYAHKAGMKFMMWFEPCRVHKDSDVHREHPEYLLYVDWDEAPVLNGGPDDYLFNLGDEEAFNFIYGKLSEKIRNDGIDYYREDNNFPPLDFWRRNDEPNRDGINEIKSINGLYRLWDSLKAEFPGLIIDNCNTGGRRLDFESCRRAAAFWRCDGSGGPIEEDRHTDVWNQNQNLSLSEYLPYHASAVWVPDANDMRSALSSGVALTFDIYNEEFDFDTAQKGTKEAAYYSKYWDGDFYPMTKYDTDESIFAAYQLAKGDDGYVTVFRRAECKDSDYVIKFNAVEADALYELKFSNEDRIVTYSRAKGSELLAGYTVTLPEPHTSLIAEYIKIK